MPDEIVSPPVQVDIDRDKIKRAVKEALDDKAIEDLGKQLTALSTQMTQGFTEVRTRQDTANGKLLTHDRRLDADEKDIQTLLKREDSQTTFWQRNQDKIVWFVVGIGLMLFYYLLTHNGFPSFLSK